MSKLLRLILVTILISCFFSGQVSAQDEILFRKHIVNSGWHGLFYGLALDIIADVDGAAAVGIPVITAGASALLPFMTGYSRDITTNSLMLTNHGKTLGWAHGFSLMGLVLGEDAFDEGTHKLTIAVGALSSIGLGRLGYSLGKNKTFWDEGQVALYRHYGWIMPFTGFSLAAAFAEDPRLFGGSVLLFGAGGYLLADQVYKSNPYTRGDIRATQTLTALHGLLGYGIAVDKGFENELARADWLIPAAGVLAGTAIGHLWLKNAALTSQQGTYCGYIAGGGAILGLGVALLIDSDRPTPWYAIPYATGMGAFAFAVEKYRKEKYASNIIPDNKNNKWDIAFMPQNYFFNQQLVNRRRIPHQSSSVIQPMLAATLKF